MLQVLQRKTTSTAKLFVKTSDLKHLPGSQVSSRTFHNESGTTTYDNVYFTFVREKMQRLVIHPIKHYGWDHKGQTVDILPAKKNQRLKEVVDKLPTRVEGPYYAHYLRYAGHLKNLTEAKRLHQHIRKSGRAREESLGHLIVKMYLDCGSLEEAKEVFYRMPRLEPVIWREMIEGCAQYGDIPGVMKVHRTVQQEGIVREKRVLLALIYVCAKLADLELAKQVHWDVVSWGLGSDLLVSNALISVYGRCGRLHIAQLIFDTIESPSVASLNALMGAYVRHGFYDDVFDKFYQFNVEGYSGNQGTFSALLSACAGPAYLKEGRLIRDCCQQLGIETNTVTGASIIRMYSSCGRLQDAQAAFDEIINRDVAGWTNLIEAYVCRGLSRQAFTTHDVMQISRVRSNRMTYIALLNACHSPQWLEKGRLVHSQILRDGWEADIKTAAALVKMYCVCGSLRDARRVFRKLNRGNALVWNAVIHGHVHALCSREALIFVWTMHLEGVRGDGGSYSGFFRACKELGALEAGKRIHAAIQGSELELEVLVGISLLELYSSYGSVEDMVTTFSRMNRARAASWNSVISAFAGTTGESSRAIEFFQRMQLEGGPPDSATFTAALGGVTTVAQGKFIHRWILESGYNSSLEVGNSLLRMFAKLKLLKLASKTFEAMPSVDDCSWTLIMETFSQSGYNLEALDLFRDMLQEGGNPGRSCLAIAMTAVAELESVPDCERIQGLAGELGLCSDSTVGAALTAMVARCIGLEEAQDIFDGIHRKDVGCWNSLLRAYSHLGHHEEAVEIFREMELEMDKVTVSIVAAAVSALGELELGRELHLRALQSKLGAEKTVVASLRGMYIKLGSMESANSL
ncbi:pentatricopeptide repeat-containing protein At4g18520, chloroplastic-like [Selaginella moellendorffii]|uniref:pentatricopeptide repeat-containing protein At4g18520, chloroplastic-like n=1 Tax=Selaginella moellendorffii TaxID=88036 RepID=UPI000D1C8DE5|nr:pentatricopeptide repeat-containing protein At4g18520, chloroplastic-like [Selaginella moellendorffii]|eukprot:XP_024520627.1 pentatricopeptide repeat-containing protein At4g18520, chloroplastic-like [Selaginella moellendorffii]